MKTGTSGHSATGTRRNLALYCRNYCFLPLNFTRSYYVLRAKASWDWVAVNVGICSHLSSGTLSGRNTVRLEEAGPCLQGLSSTLVSVPPLNFFLKLGKILLPVTLFKIVQCRVRDPQFRMCGNLNQVKGRGNCPRVGARSTVQTQPIQSPDGVGVWREEAQACSRMAALLFGGWKSGHQNTALAALPQTFPLLIPSSATLLMAPTQSPEGRGWGSARSRPERAQC